MACRHCSKEFTIFRRARRCTHCQYQYCKACSDHEVASPFTHATATVCAFCVRYWTVNTSNEHHLKTLAISTLRDYIKAYNIDVEDPTVKHDIISGILAARGTNGWILPANEDYYRRNSVPYVVNDTHHRSVSVVGRRVSSTTIASSSSSTSQRIPPRPRSPVAMFQMYGCDTPKVPKPLIKLPHKSEKGKGKQKSKPAEDLHEVICLDSVKSELESISSGSTTPVHAVTSWQTRGDMGRYPEPSLSRSTTDLVPPTPNSPPSDSSHIFEDPASTLPVSPYTDSPIDDRPPTYQSSRYDIGVDEMPSFPDCWQPPSPSPPLASPISPRSLSSKKSRLQYRRPGPGDSHDQSRAYPLSHSPPQFQHSTQVGSTLPESQPSHTPRSRSMSSLNHQYPPFSPPPSQHQHQHQHQHPLHQPPSRKPRPLPLPPGPPQPHLFHDKLAVWDCKEREWGDLNVSPRSPLPLSPRTPTSPRSTTSTSSLCVICDDFEADIVVVQCGHLAMCRTCADMVMARGRECPLCRVPIVTEASLLRVFKP